MLSRSDHNQQNVSDFRHNVYIIPVGKYYFILSMFIIWLCLG